jgi:hypothetical protein
MQSLKVELILIFLRDGPQRGFCDRLGPKLSTWPTSGWAGARQLPSQVLSAFRDRYIVETALKGGGCDPAR